MRYGRLACVLAVVAVLALSGAARAGSYTWNVPSGNWSAAGSWTPAGGPPATSADTGAISSGTATADATLGAPANWPAISVNSGGAVYISVDIATPLTLNGGTLLSNRQAHRTYSGDLTVQDDSTIKPNGSDYGSTLTISGTITGTKKLTVDSPSSTVKLDATNTGFSGNWEVVDTWHATKLSHLAVNADGALGLSNVVDVNNLGQLHMTAAQTASASAPTVNINPGGTLHISSDGVDMTFNFEGGELYTGNAFTVSPTFPGTFNINEDATFIGRGNYGGSLSVTGHFVGSKKITYNVGAYPLYLQSANPGFTGEWEVIASRPLYLDADYALDMCGLTINGGVVQYLAGVSDTITVTSLNLGGTDIPADPTPYDITDTNGGGTGVNFANYFNGTGTITVVAPSGAPIPEPAGLGLLGLALLALKKRRS